MMLPAYHPTPNSMILRYAILHHTQIPSPHFDLLFQSTPCSPLITWRSPIWPILNPTPLERLADHRPAYLDYEGPVSNNRGEVRRIAAGVFHFESIAENHFRIKTDMGVRLSCRQCKQPNIWLADVDQTP
jgi:hypothetical protein